MLCAFGAQHSSADDGVLKAVISKLRQISSVITKWARSEARTRDQKCVQKLVGKSVMKTQPGRPRKRWNVYIKIHFKET
jgi:hypothetical protein